MARKSLPRSLAVVLIVALSLAAAAGAWRFEHDRARDERDARARTTASALRFQLAAVVISLEGLRGLVEGAGGAPTAAAFTPFAANALARSQAILAVWAPRVTAGERAAWERRTGHSIIDPNGRSPKGVRASARPVYFPVELDAPATLGTVALGLDVQRFVGAPVIQKARTSGRTQFSRPVSLPVSGTALILVRAVYGDGTEENSRQGRLRSFSGVVASANSLDTIADAVLETLPRGTRMEIREGDDVLLRGRGDMDGAGSVRIEVGGRAWTVLVAGAPGASLLLPVTVLIGGLIVAALVGLLLLLSSRRQAEAERAAAELERRVEERTAALADANRELEAFSYSVSHDLRAPLRSVGGLSAMLVEDHADELRPEAHDLLMRIRAAGERMGALIDDLLGLARVSRADMRREPVDLGAMAERVVASLHESDPGRSVEVRIAPGLDAEADPRLMRVVLDNLIGNAWKFTRDQPHPVVEVGAEGSDGDRRFFVRDNGAGFDMAYAGKLFGPFQRLHHADEFEGTGIGLATVQRIVRRHGGDIWAEGEVGAGATVSFTLPAENEEP
jgi:signal transduction histidine kinase